ncbi:hypothetical protein B0T24DRAFT_259410 [Lasiosphaeria ovina]|uniref:Secreted protein n=1 Tax=Lasiosphaeria ovina TaxID=92902 RepID=A0AAE0N789_9PEZI|nr:hypothetical protein B0T24DRAFT_259410 [Lasiosphaeria ovina]
MACLALPWLDLADWAGALAILGVRLIRSFCEFLVSVGSSLRLGLVGPRRPLFFLLLNMNSICTEYAHRPPLRAPKQVGQAWWLFVYGVWYRVCLCIEAIWFSYQVTLGTLS